MNNICDLSSKERGQSMVELAVSLTFFLILLAGTIDLGRALFTWLALRDAAQEGASYGSFKPTDVSGIQNRVWDNLEQVTTNPAADVTVNVIVPNACSGETITVNVIYPTFPLGMPFLGTILGSQTISIRATINDTIIIPLCP